MTNDERRRGRPSALRHSGFGNSLDIRHQFYSALQLLKVRLDLKTWVLKA
jgi:hypothetical protein